MTPEFAAIAAVRVQVAIDRIAAFKARPRAEVRAERRLTERLGEVLGPVIDRVLAGVDERGFPGDELSARLLLGDLGDVQERLLEVLVEEVGEEAAGAIGRVEAAVEAAATKALSDVLPDALRGLGVDRRIVETLTRVGGRMLERFASSTLEALVAAADVDMPAADVRAVLAERLAGQLSQLSRHALGDARNEATVVAEESLGVRWHQWVTAGDDDVRPAHADVDGEIVRVGEPFSNGWMRPGGVGCRCSLVPWFPPEGSAAPAGVDRFVEAELGG